MERALVSLRATETHRELLTEAVECSDEDGVLTLLWHLDETAYDADVGTLESVGRVEHTDYDHRSVVEGAAGDAREFVESTVATADLDARIVVSVDSETSRARRVLDAARAHDCDHVFIVGTDRSPTGKAVFGDFAQEVILGFDGFTTVVTGRVSRPPRVPPVSRGGRQYASGFSWSGRTQRRTTTPTGPPTIPENP